jgi:hypothetical protein
VALLKAVNDLRAGEGSKPLQWDADAAKAAAAWAKLAGWPPRAEPHGVAPGCRWYMQNFSAQGGPELKASLGAGRYPGVTQKIIDVARGMWGEKQFLPPGTSCATPKIHEMVKWPIGHYCTLANPGAKGLGGGAAPALYNDSGNTVVSFILHVS